MTATKAAPQSQSMPSAPSARVKANRAALVNLAEEARAVKEEIIAARVNGEQKS